MSLLRFAPRVALAIACGLLVGCGDGSPGSGPPTPSTAPLGSASNPVQALPNPSRTRTPPSPTAAQRGSGTKVSDPDAPGAASEGKPAPGAKHPCLLVPEAQARAILGRRIRPPLQAQQGPTCIYRAASSAAFVTLTVQPIAFSKLRRQIRRPTRVAVSTRTGYCGVLGRPMLYVPLADGQVLTVSAPCAVAARFAAQALQRL